MFKKDDIVIFFGDSITESNKTKDEWAIVSDAIGNGFVNMINSHYYLNTDLNLRIINKGTSGDRTFDLIERIDQDVLIYKPNHVFIMIGINDIWRMFDMPQIKDFKTNSLEYNKNIEELVTTLLSEDINVILLTPFYLETNLTNPIRKMVDLYNNELRNISLKYNLTLIDLQKSFDKLLNNKSSFLLSRDLVHVNMMGHTYIKDEILKIIK